MGHGGTTWTQILTDSYSQVDFFFSKKMVIYFALTYNGKYGGVIKFSKNFAGLTLHDYNTKVSSLVLPFQCRKGSN